VNVYELSPSGANLQPLEYIVVSEPEQCQKVFPHTAWAGYLPDWSPGPKERPMAYIFILINREVRDNAPMDVGIAAENITLVALARSSALWHITDGWPRLPCRTAADGRNVRRLNQVL